MGQVYMSTQTRSILPDGGVDQLHGDIQWIIDTATYEREDVQEHPETLALRYLKNRVMLAYPVLMMREWFTPAFLDTFTQDFDAYGAEDYPGLTPEIHEAIYWLLADANMEPYEHHGEHRIRPLIGPGAYRPSEFYGQDAAPREDDETGDPAEDPEEL